MIKITLCLLFSIFMTASSGCDTRNSPIKEPIQSPATIQSIQECMLTGADQIEKYLPLLKGKKVGLAVNQTSEINGTHLVDTLLQLGVKIERIFAPEHGFRGDHSAGATVSDMIDAKTGIPVVSLYGKNKKPKTEDIQDLDVILFDIQDVGVRFYTYISTMHYLMERAAELNKLMLVLDRPNPNGFYIDGPMLESDQKSFIGMHAIPLVHGLTVAELALMINGEKWLEGGKSCRLEIIPCKNYTHDSLYQLPIRPSPNLPNMYSVYLYPTLGLFEGTNVSLGRGTEFPFQLLGKPGYNGSFVFTPKSIPGVAEDPKFKNQECRGELLRSEVAEIIKHPGIRTSWLLEHYRQNNEKAHGDFFLSSFNKLAGTSQLAEQIRMAQTPEQISQSWEAGLNAYRPLRKKYLLYPDFTNSQKILDIKE